MPHSRWHTSVKPLVEFCCRSGDLGYTEAPAARAEQGQMAQRRVQATPPPGYRKEIPVDDSVSHHGLTLTISGRIDGVFEDQGELVIEEIKSTYFHADTLPSPLFVVHQAQAICYAAMWPDARRYASIRIRVTYFQLKDETTFVREVTLTREDILQRYAGWTEDYCLWLRLLADHRTARDDWAKTLAFPFSHYRRGQRTIAVHAWRDARDRKTAMFEAPTGAGKTISLLFPALKRFGDAPAQRVFYLTAKNSGQRTVQQTLQRLQETDLPLLSVFLGARQQLCPCAPEASATMPCSRCVGYHDRKRAAMEHAVALKRIDRLSLQALADTFMVCPHQLAMDLCGWADMVIGDFNYLFDPFTRQAMGNAFDEDSLLLVDEAHNLPERARSMYTCMLAERDIDVLLGLKPPPPARKALRALQKVLRHPLDMPQPSTREDIPANLVHGLQAALENIREWMDEQPALLTDDGRFDLWMRMFALQRAIEHWGDHYCLMQQEDPAQITAYCLDPGFFLADTWQQSRAALLFSGTLQPTDWFAQSLGLQRLPADRRGEDILVEHALENTEVKAAVLALPMQYSSRLQSLPVAVPYIEALLKTQPGRYLIAAASFEILGQLSAALMTAMPDYQWSVQTSAAPDSRNNDADRQRFLAEFVGAERSAALVITGGVFAEGIDLADTPLAGVIQIGLPLPPPSEERKRLQEYYQSHFGQGFEYTYSYPAIARTLQTCGRLLRKDGDRGCLLLVDARFLRAPYAHFLPSHWQKKRITSIEGLMAFVQATSHDLDNT